MDKNGIKSLDKGCKSKEEYFEKESRGYKNVSHRGMYKLITYSYKNEKKKKKKKLTITIKKSKFRTSRKWTWLQLFCFNGSKILSPVLVSCLQPQLCSWRRYGHTMCPRWKELSEWRVLETLCPNKSISFDSNGFFNSKWHPQVMYFVNFWMSWESPCFPLCLL